MTPAELAGQAAEAVRALNHSTLPGADGLQYPAGAYDVTGQLAVLAARLLQALAQFLAFLQEQAAAGAITVVAGQKIALGRIHAGQVVTVHVAAEVITIDMGGEDTRTVRRTTTQPVRSIKAHQPRDVRATHVS